MVLAPTCIEYFLNTDTEFYNKMENDDLTCGKKEKENIVKLKTMIINICLTSRKH